jgi:hypothetical protein
MGADTWKAEERQWTKRANNNVSSGWLGGETLHSGCSSIGGYKATGVAFTA